MSLFSRLFEKLGYVKVQAHGGVWHEVGTSVSDAGVQVTNTTAMRASAVMACVRVLADTLAQIPLVLYRRVGPNKERATDHWLHQVLKRPNPQQTAFEFRQMLQGHVALRGNAYCVKEYSGIGQIEQLIPLHPDRVSVEAEDGVIMRYKYRTQRAGETTYQPERIIHFKGLSTDGVIGLNPIEHAAQQIGIALAADKFGAKFFGNGAQATGVFKHPGTLSPTALDNLRNSLAARIGGDNMMKPLVVEEGMEYTQLTIAPEQAQFLETRKFSVTDIARIFRVPPHMVGDLERATFSNIEQQALGFVTNSMLPWFVNWEQRLSAACLPEWDQEEYFLEFLVDGLLRGDAKARAESNQLQFMNGAMTLDEWRAMENRDPLPDDLGTKHYRPANLVEVGDEPEPQPAGAFGQPPQEEPQEEPEENPAQATVERLLDDAAARIAAAELREKAKGGFDAEGHQQYADRVLEPFGLTWMGHNSKSKTVDGLARHIAKQLKADYHAILSHS